MSRFRPQPAAALAVRGATTGRGPLDLWRVLPAVIVVAVVVFAASSPAEASPVLRAPADKSTVLGEITVQVTRSQKVTRVAFQLDGRVVDVDRKPPFRLGNRSRFDTRYLPNGRHVLKVRISRHRKKAMRRTRVLMVNNPAPAGGGTGVAAPGAGATPLPTTGVFVSSTGSDETGNGTLGRPFRTVTRGADAAKPGDAVWVRGGVYGATRIRRSGSSGAPITISPYPGEAVVFDGSAGLLGANSVVTIERAAYLVFQGFEVRNSGARGISAVDGYSVAVRSNSVHDTRDHAIMGSGDGLSFEGNEIYRASLGNQGGGSGYWAPALSTWLKSDGQRSTNVIFKGNRVRDSWGEGITALHANNVSFVGNTVSNVWSVDLYLDNAADVRLEGNNVSNPDPTFYRDGRPANGIALANEYYPNADTRPTENITIANNRISQSRDGVGYWHDYRRTVDNTYRNVQIYGNTFTNTTTAPISMQDVPTGQPQPTGNVARGNTIYRGYDGSTINVGDPGGWTFADNSFPTGR